MDDIRDPDRRPRHEPWGMRPLHGLPGARKTGLTAGRVLAAAGLTLAGVLMARAVVSRAAGPPPRRRPPARRPTAPVEKARAEASRSAMEGAATLAGSVLLDSATEHFRGNYHNRAMYVAPAVASATITAAVGGRQRGVADASPSRSGEAVFWLGALTGLAGFGFHLYNIGQRPGGFRSMNSIFYAAPIGAPGALMGAGLYGLAGCALRRAPVLAPRDEGRLLGAFTALSLLATTAEVGLLHFRGAFQDRAMYIPVTIPPAAGLALAAAVAHPDPRLIRLARAGCRVTMAVGAAGVGFHAYGVHRNFGGWGNWRQNMIQGPPLFAPPSFIGLARTGLGALHLVEQANR